jgi:hypothetical protein
VPVDTGAGVSPAVFDSDVESETPLLPRARRADLLHCGGGYIFLDWAPISGNAPTGGADVVEGYFACRYWPEILFKAELHVRDGGEYIDDRFPGTSMYSNDDCTSIWVTGDPADQWWPTSSAGESVGRRAFCLGADAACEDGGAVGPLSVYWCRGVCLWVHPRGLVSREGADVAPEDSIECAWGTRAAVEAAVDCIASPWWWRRGPLLFGRGSLGMAADATGDFAVPLCRGGLPG